MRKSLVVILVLVLASSIAITGCTAPSNEIVIGALLSQTGDNSSLGESAQAALEIAKQDIDEYLSSIGSAQNVRFDIEDTGNQPALASEKLMSLNNRGIKVVIGPQSSAQVEAIKDYAAANGMVLISPSSTAPSLATEDNVLRFCPDDTNQAEAITNLVWEDGVRALIPMYRGDIWGDDLVAAINTAFTAKGGKMFNGVRYSTSERDFTAQLDNLTGEVNNEIAAYGNDLVAVILLSFEQDGTLILSEAATIPDLSSLKWYGSDGTALAKGLISDTAAAEFASKTGFLSPIFGGVETEQGQTVADRLQAKINRPPDGYSLASYDAAWVTSLAYLALRGNDDPEALKKAIIQNAGSYYGLTGWTILNSAGDRNYFSYDFWSINTGNNTFEWNRAALYYSQPVQAGIQREDNFPNKPINIITGWLGGSEQFLNSIAAAAEKTLGVPVEIVNKVGNDGADAVQAFEAAPRDGYTLMLFLDFYASGFAQGTREADPTKDWIPLLIGNLAVSQIYIRPEDSRFSSWDEVVEYSKNHGNLSIGTIGSPLDMENVMLANLERAFGIELEQVPIEASPERNAAFMSGQFDLLIDQPGDIKEYISSGKFEPVLTLWNDRIRGFESIPTPQEKGVDFTPLLRIRGLVAPDGTPSNRIEKLKSGLEDAFNSQKFQQNLHERMLDLVPYPVDPLLTVTEQVYLYEQLYDAMGIKITKLG